MAEVSDEGSEWCCIDGVIEEVTSSLAVGEMITTPTFSLYDSMSAVELMDPKMDPPKQHQKAIDLNAMMMTGELPLVNISLSEARRICSKLLTLEISWIDGTSMAETMFTCFYLHDPVLPLLISTFQSLSKKDSKESPKLETLAEGCLSCFVVLLLKNVALIREIVFHADIYEVSIHFELTVSLAY